MKTLNITVDTHSTPTKVEVSFPTRKEESPCVILRSGKISSLTGSLRIIGDKAMVRLNLNDDTIDDLTTILKSRNGSRYTNVRTDSEIEIRTCCITDSEIQCVISTLQKFLCQK